MAHAGSLPRPEPSSAHQTEMHFESVHQGTHALLSALRAWTCPAWLHARITQPAGAWRGPSASRPSRAPTPCPARTRRPARSALPAARAHAPAAPARARTHVKKEKFRPCGNFDDLVPCTVPCGIMHPAQNQECMTGTDGKIGTQFKGGAILSGSAWHSGLFKVHAALILQTSKRVPPARRRAGRTTKVALASMASGAGSWPVSHLNRSGFSWSSTALKAASSRSAICGRRRSANRPTSRSISRNPRWRLRYRSRFTCSRASSTALYTGKKCCQSCHHQRRTVNTARPT